MDSFGRTPGDLAMLRTVDRLGRWLWEQPSRAVLPLLLLAAFALRFGTALALPSQFRPDEIFQSLEPAHRLWTGWGVVTWEWRDGIRSWLLPGALAAVMRLFGSAGPASYLPAVAAALSLVSLSTVAAAFILGRQHSGRVGAVLCGTLCAVWPDLVYFAPKALTEVIGGNVLVMAVLLAGLLTTRPGLPRRVEPFACAGIGFTLALALVLRVQLAPAAWLAGAWACRLEVRARWLPLLAGAAIPLVACGVLDAATWGSPFQSLWKNFSINVLHGKASHFGNYGLFWYFRAYVHSWGAAVVPLAALFAIGARRMKLPAATTVVVVLAHMAIRHKELSFVYAALPPALIVVGAGTAQVVLRLGAILGATRYPRRVTLVAAGAWALVALFVALGGGFAGNWYNLAEQRAQVADLRRQADLCGLGVFGPGDNWAWLGGYAVLDRPVPIVIAQTAPDIAAAAGSVNHVIVDTAQVAAVPGFTVRSCGAQTCVLHADHACAPPPSGSEINAYLQAKGL